MKPSEEKADLFGHPLPPFSAPPPGIFGITLHNKPGSGLAAKPTERLLKNAEFSIQNSFIHLKKCIVHLPCIQKMEMQT